MISQNCPRCGSGRIRRGYRNTPFWSKIIGRYNLLCNNCNWEFVGFAVPGTVPSHSDLRRKKRRDSAKQRETFNDSNESDNGTEQTTSEPDFPATENGERSRIRVKKRVRVKLNK